MAMEVLLDADTIQGRVRELAQEIERDHPDADDRCYSSDDDCCRGREPA